MFEEDGEDHFRKNEAKILRWFAEKKIYVLSTGGGTPCFHENMQWMNSQGITIWINEPVEVLAERLKPEKEHRPLIKELSDEALTDFLQQKLDQRRPFYSQAKIILEGNDIQLKKIMQLIAGFE